MANKTTIIVWFRTDLRLQDNPALYAAVKHGERIIPVYIHAPHEEAQWQPGAASRWWLHHSLASLARDLKQRGSRLVLRRGDSREQLQRLIEQTGATAVYTTRCYSPAAIERDNKIQRALRTADIDFTLYNGNVLVEPDSIHNKAGQPFKVFTPFWRTHQQHFSLPGLLPAPRRLPAVPTRLSSIALGKLELLPKLPWDKGLRQSWATTADTYHRDHHRLSRCPRSTRYCWHQSVITLFALWRTQCQASCAYSDAIAAT